MTKGMLVEVRVVCAPHPREKVESALHSAGEQLAFTADSVSVRMDAEDPRIAVLAFRMRRAAQYKVVDEIFATVEFWAMAFYEDITVGFPKY